MLKNLPKIQKIFQEFKIMTAHRSKDYVQCILVQLEIFTGCHG